MMKSLLFFSTLLFAFTTATVNVDTEASQIIWKGYKVTGSHEGTIKVENGELTFDDGTFTGGSFDIDMSTIAVTDLQGGMAQKLEGHLKSPDFFGVEKYPTATFNITKVVSRGTPGDYRVTGDLTIKETTKTIRFNANVTEEGGLYVATADVTIDRSDFDVRYGSGSFFDNLGDKTIYDEFELGIKLVTKK
ncbi:YceI family protein [Lewinella sp. W8]|uniref:YceI family protein n=1 Tax=Lewinella sp. W8 TaxID=2528208 RepID=UPI001068BA02|nr:YceI family protein [Lewinella sp. W8]MTB51353.1 YceI family protein [Lewinella sp. W8]